MQLGSPHQWDEESADAADPGDRAAAADGRVPDHRREELRSVDVHDGEARGRHELPDQGQKHLYELVIGNLPHKMHIICVINTTKCQEYSQFRYAIFHRTGLQQEASILERGLLLISLNLLFLR